MRFLKCHITVILLFCIVFPVSAEDDILQTVLDEAGFTKADLGYQPKGYWNRFPLDIPHKLGSFDDLFAEPLKLYDYARVMSNTVELYMEPSYADTTDDALYKLVYNLGVDKKLGGFRSYSANLLPAPDSDDPLMDAVEYLYMLDGQPSDYFTFGQYADWPEYKQVLTAEFSILPDTAKTILAELLINLGEAIRWRNLAFRNCDLDDMQRVMRIDDLANTQTDGTVYYPEIDDIAGSLDWPSLHYAALKTASAVEKAEHAFRDITSALPPQFTLEFATPFGTVMLLSSVYKVDKLPPPKTMSATRAPIPGWYICDATDCLLIIDFGRNTIYDSSPGASNLHTPVSAVIDLGGDDYYGFEQEKYKPSTGVGILGVGLVVDSDGNDYYNGSTYAQGFGMFGVGVLYDRKGADKYTSELSSQGCGYFGIGLCLDGTGDDEYYLYASGQGMGGVGGGIGVCASYGGNDKYTAEPYSEVYNRGDYHSDHKINGNEAQGAGMGRRGDGSDGHSWAGGLGAIIDIAGDDIYYSGNWSLGIGYWYGTGIAIDKNGDDIYKSCYFTQGSGAHFCNGILIDENGDDRHELYETAGAALGFGWDYTNAFLINKGGNDFYKANMISMGLAQIRSNAFLIDIGGNDEYQLAEGTPGLGEATFREDYRTPSQLTPYYYYAKSIGVFIDIGGDDKYLQFNKETGVTNSHTSAKNNLLWMQPSREDSTFGWDNYGIGVDTETGIIPEFIKWDEK